VYFNNPKSVFALVEAIAATSSKKEKEALVKTGMGLPLFVKVVTATYDRFKRYGVTPPERTPGIAPGANTLEEPFVWNLLAGLAAGQITGNMAINEVQKMVDFLDEPSSALFRRILLKDMRAGFTDGTVNRVAPGTFVEFPYQRCSLPAKSHLDKWEWSYGIISQEKADGMFANVNRSAAGEVWITSRQGSPFPRGAMPALEAEIARVLSPNTQTHGELLVFEESEAPEGPLVLLPREKGNGVLNSLLEGGALEPHQVVRFMAWDQIPMDAVKPKGKYALGYKQRLTALLRQLKTTGLVAGKGLVQVIPTRIVKSKQEAMDHYRELLVQGKEGTIVSNPDGHWKDGTSKDKIKLKLQADVDLEVIAVVPGRADTKNAGRAGSLTCKTACGQLVTDVAVKNEAMRDAIDANPGDWLNRIMPVRANMVLTPSASNDLHSLFLPRFVEDQYRRDKEQADDLARVREQFDAAIAA
jgi:DNA ligase-1